MGTVVKKNLDNVYGPKLEIILSLTMLLHFITLYVFMICPTETPVIFYGDGLSTSNQPPKLEDHPCIGVALLFHYTVQVTTYLYPVENPYHALRKHCIHSKQFLKTC